MSDHKLQLSNVFNPYFNILGFDLNAWQRTWYWYVLLVVTVIF